MKVPFLSLQHNDEGLKAEVQAAVQKIFDQSAFIGGPAVAQFEKEFAAYGGAARAVGVANGTDALVLALRAAGVGPGDEVILPTFTFIATAEAVSLVGADVKFADIDPLTFNLDPASFESVITPKTKAVLPVHLFGQPADMEKILAIAEAKNITVIADAAQAHGAKFKNQPLGKWGKAVCFSFYPTKNLSGSGDGGAVISNDGEFLDRVARFGNHGRAEQYFHVEIGTNSRLDGIQAAVLSIYLKRLDEWNQKRRGYAKIYDDALKGHSVVQSPHVHPEAEPVYHLYSVSSERREKLKNYLLSQDIGVGVYYPLPVHLQPAYQFMGHKEGDFPQAEAASETILSLPMHPFLSEDQIIHTAHLLQKFKG